MSIVQARVPVVWRPQPRQAEFMSRPEPEALYGGAAGGGKSDALVIEALRQVHIPHYRALLMRKTYPQLSDLVDKSQVYYHRAFPQAQYNATAHVWNFPSGAKIYFGSMQYTKDRTNYQGKAFAIIDYAELMAEDQVSMSMEAWLRETARFLANNRRNVLEGKGHISREAAMKKVGAVYEEFRKKQDADYVSDFDRAMEKYLKGGGDS